MIEPQTFALFLLTAIVLVVSPGPDTVLILSRTLASGRRAGLMTLVGTQVGNVAHALLAGWGVSGVILLFPYAFDALRYLGAAYLAFLAVMAWRAPAALELNARLVAGPAGPLRFFYQGLASNLVNPKMIPFFIALFPQFVRPADGMVALQSAILGVTLAAMAIVWIGALVLLVSRFRAILATNGRFLSLANKIAGVTFLGLAGRLVLQERN